MPRQFNIRISKKDLMERLGIKEPKIPEPLDVESIIQEVLSRIPTEPKETIIKEVVTQITKVKDKKLHIKNIGGVQELQDLIVRHSVEQARGLLYAGLLENKQNYSSGVPPTIHYETPLTGTLGTDSVYTFAHAVGQLVLNNATQDPNLDYSGQGTTTATFLNGFIPTGTSLLNIYIT